MRLPQRSVLAAALFLVLAAFPSEAQRPVPKKGEVPAKGTAEPKAKPISEPDRGQERVPVAGLRGTLSPGDENEACESDPRFDFRARLKPGGQASTGATASGATSATSAAVRRRLADHPRREELARWLEDALRDREIDVALLGGHKYMINSCLGIKVSAGEFRLKLENPVVRFENTGLVLTFAVQRVSFSAIKLRMRPNPNPLELCKFGKKFEVGGSMEDVRLTLRFDPLYDFEQCRVGGTSDMNPEVRIGNLNLKPLQNDLDRMAKDMVEDALTFTLQLAVDGVWSAFGDLVFSSIDRFLEADCPTQAGETARAVGGIGRAVGGGKNGAGASTAGSAAGANTTGSAAPASTAPEVDALLARIARLEARIAELEAGAPPAGDLRALLELVIERLGVLEPGALSGDELRGLLAQLLAASLERSTLGEPRAALDELVRMTLAPRVHAAEPVSAGAAANAGWYLVPNPELKGRMGRVVVRFPDAKLAGSTIVQLDRDGKKVTDGYGEAAWELFAGVHDVQITRAPVRGLEVRAGHDTVVRTGLLVIELASSTIVAIFPKGGKDKLTDGYGSLTIGLPIGDYEVEIQGQRASVTVREGEITRF